ncbi:DUF1549 domain-containing protein [Compostibacter hankyongensis]|uniref:Cytochrome c domain-containing protein n=1 Tax=Compostibacter hankyongensis TaxID=1007089 RepID=A0ABP8FZE1_9BACT
MSGLISLFVSLVIVSPAAGPGAKAAAGGHFWLWSFLGRLHPMIVHFPIGLLFVALLLDLLGGKQKSDQFRAAIRVLVFAGALSAVASVVFGLLLSNTDEYGGTTLSLHQWSGIATMVLALLTTWACIRHSPRLRRVLLCITVIGVTVAGHFGATLTHGEGYLSSVLPGGNAAPAAGKTLAMMSQNVPLNDTQVQELNLQVRTILAHNCTSCHGSAKVKGELRLDSKAMVMKGGKNGPVLVAGHPEKSELIRRVLLSRTDKKAMPAKGKGLTKEEIAVLQFWIKQGAPWPDGPQKSLFRLAELEPRNPPVPVATDKLTSPVDRFVNTYFQQHKISWKKPVDDRTYIRRVYLDVIGLLPPADSVDAFVKDTRPDKRGKLVSRLLARDEAYAEHWLTFWNDALRNDYTGTGYITGGRWDITKWLYTSLRDNKPYNIFVKELISPDKTSQGFIKGIRWRGTINSSQSTEMQAAQNVSQIFLGLNLKCASCHDSFISDWKLADAYAFANLFCDSTLEINRCDKPTGKMAGRRILFQELGTIDSSAGTKERLKQLAEFMTEPKDGRLYRTLVNRIWAQVMGRGIVAPVDMMDNVPWSQDLLDWLASDFTASGYDIKKLLYTILTSQTYQLPSVTMENENAIVAENFVFRGMLRRRLTAEQFSDAVSETIYPVYTDSAKVYRLLPEDVRTDKVPFTRASLVKNDAFQTALGRPNRETVATSRPSQSSLLQALELTNGTLFNTAMKLGADKWKKAYPDPEEMVKEVFRSTLGRAPTDKEQTVAMGVLGDAPTVANIQDFMWSVTLLPEFQLIY